MTKHTVDIFDKIPPDGKIYIGTRPDGLHVYADISLIAQRGIDEVRAELVEVYWHRQGLVPPGYYKVRTHPFNDDHVLVKANSHEDAVEKYLKHRKAEANSRDRLRKLIISGENGSQEALE